MKNLYLEILKIFSSIKSRRYEYSIKKMDLTAGGTFAVLGWNNKEINDSLSNN